MEVWKERSRWVVMVGVCGLACAGAISLEGAVSGQEDVRAEATSAGPGGPGYFRADLTVRQRRIGANGVPMASAGTDSRMRVEREVRNGRLRTSLVMDAPPRVLLDTPGGARSITNPASIARIEFEDGDEAPRMYDHEGRRVRPLSDDALRLLGGGAVTPTERRTRQGVGRGLLASLVAEPRRRGERRLELQRQFGASTGRVRGLDRFAVVEDGQQIEVLATTDDSLPVEINTSRVTGGEMRTAIVYASYGTRGQVRRLTRTEQTFGQGVPDRAITEVELSNVVIADEVTP